MTDLAQVVEIQGGPSVVMPEGMALEAQAVWQRVVETGLVRLPADRDTLRAYCEAAARYEHAAALLASSGPLVRKGLAVNPLHQVAREDAQLMRAMARELDLEGRARQQWEFPF